MIEPLNRLIRNMKFRLKRMFWSFSLCSVAVSVLLCLVYFSQNPYIWMKQNGTATSDLSLRSLQTSDTPLVVFVLSRREAFNRRNAIRKSWAAKHKHVYFVVSELYCQHPPENRVPGKCISKDKSVKGEQIRSYTEKEEAITRKLRNESNVVLVHTVDMLNEMQKMIKESYIWALHNLNAKWILHVDDSVDVKVETLETRLKTSFDASKNIVLISMMKCEVDIGKHGVSYNSSFKPGYFKPFSCTLNHLVSKQIALYMQNGGKNVFEYTGTHYDIKMRITDSSYIKSIHREEDFSLVTVNGTDTSTGILVLGFKLDNKHVKSNENSYMLTENPSNYLHSDRFDLIVKMVYAYHYVFEKHVPPVIKAAYKEHLRVWNNFKESCKLREIWYDSKIACTAKKNSSDFIKSFHRTIETIKKRGFNPSMSRIPVDKNGFLNNGAHRLSTSIILSKNATFEHHTYKEHPDWGYNFFKRSGMSEQSFNVVMLEWMKIQMKLSHLSTSVSVISIFSNNKSKDVTMRKIVKEQCSKEKSILYETNANVTKQGARQLISHMYGQQSWLETKIQQMLSKFSSKRNVLFLFVYSKGTEDMVLCKDEIRKLYNDKIFKSTVHIPDTAEENLILAEMILNNNSLQFMNYAKNAPDCKLIAKEIANRSLSVQIHTLPGIYVGRDDVMIDSGTVLGLFWFT